MDLNHLYFEHQILRMQADRSVAIADQTLHDRGAALIAGRIGCIQRAVGAAGAANWSAIAANDSDGTGLSQELHMGPVRGPINWKRPAS